MAFETWVPPVKPRAIGGTSMSKMQRMEVAEFGDGYEQRAPVGLNSIRETWKLAWPGIPDADADEIEAFFVGKGMALAFWYRVPGRSTAKRYVFTSFDRYQVAGHLDGIDIGLKEVFDLEEPSSTPPSPDPVAPLEANPAFLTLTGRSANFSVGMSAAAASATITGGEAIMTPTDDEMFLDFMTGLLDPRLNFTRDSDGLYLGSDGLMKVATPDMPRFDYDYTQPGSPVLRGLLMEGTATNQVLHCRDLTNAAWVKSGSMTAAKDQIGVDGVTNSASRLTAAGANQTCLQAISDASNVARTYSVYLKRLVGTGNIQLTLDNGSTWTTVVITAGWTRVAVTQTLINPTVGIRIVTSGDSIAVDLNQEEERLAATSPIITTTAQATRATEVCSMTGTDFSDWFVPGPGTMFSQYMSPLGTVSSTRYHSAISNGTIDEAFQLLLDLPGGGTRLQVRDNATLIANLDNAPATGVKTVHKHIMAWTDTPSYSLRGYGDGISAGTDATGALPTVDRLFIGTNGSGGQHIYGWVQKFQYWDEDLPNTFLDQRTT